MYKFTRIRVPGWDFYQASPGLEDRHLVQFPQAGITPANRYQLLMFVDGATIVSLDKPSMQHIMQPGQTSLDFPIGAFQEGSIWTERPAVPGARRLCLSPAGPLRRWNRVVLDLEPGAQVNLMEGELAILLAGEADVTPDGFAITRVGPGAHVTERWVRAATSTRLLVSSFA